MRYNTLLWMNATTHMNGPKSRAGDLVGPALKLPILIAIDIIHRRITKFAITHLIKTRSVKTTKMAAPIARSARHLTLKRSDGARVDLILHRSLPEPGTNTHVTGLDLHHGKRLGLNITPDGATMINTMIIYPHQRGTITVAIHTLLDITVGGDMMIAHTAPPAEMGHGTDHHLVPLMSGVPHLLRRRL